MNVSGNLNVADVLYVLPPSLIPNPTITSTTASPVLSTNPSKEYTFWYFASSGNFSVTSSYNIRFNYVVVGGGGGGGSGSSSGGGGGGGIAVGTFIPDISTNPITYNITIGLGGLGGNTGNSGSNGNGSSIRLFSGSPFTLGGGGGGGASDGGTGGTGTGGTGNYSGTAGGNSAIIGNTDSTSVSPINTFYLDSLNNGYYDGSYAYYSGGGGGGGNGSNQGSQALTTNLGSGGGPGGGNGSVSGSGEPGLWFGGGGGGGGGGGSGGNGNQGLVIIWTETANLTIPGSEVDISGNLNVSGNTTISGLLDVELLPLPNILTITSLGPIPSPTQTIDGYTYYVFDTDTSYNIQFNYSLRQLNYCILGPGGNGAVGVYGGGIYPDTYGGGGGGGGFYSGTILSISSGLTANIIIASTGSNSSILYDNNIISTANTGGNGTPGDDTGDNGTGGTGGSSSGTGGTSVQGNAGAASVAGSPGQSFVTFGITTINFSTNGTGGVGGVYPSNPTNGYKGYGVIWFLNTDITTITNTGTLSTTNLVVSGDTTIDGSLNLTNPINTIYSTLPTFSPNNNIGYTITAPGGYISLPNSSSTWVNAYTSPPLMGVYVVTCRQWLSNNTNSGGFGGVICISYYSSFFDENCFATMTPSQLPYWNPTLGNGVYYWISSSLTRIVSLNNASIYINNYSTWDTNLSYEIVKIA